MVEDDFHSPALEGDPHTHKPANQKHGPTTTAKVVREGRSENLRHSVENRQWPQCGTGGYFPGREGS